MNVKRTACVFLLVLTLLIGAVPVFAAGKININTASVEQLVEIKGVGEVLAQRIIEYRQTYGVFKSLDELEQVKGVGRKTLDKLIPYLTISEG